MRPQRTIPPLTLLTAWTRAVVTCACILGATSCATKKVESNRQNGLTPSNTAARDGHLPSSFRRVALMPLAVTSPDLKPAIDCLETTLREEAGDARRFEVVVVSQEQLVRWTGKREFASDLAYWPAALIKGATDELRCDGILFAQITQFHAYPPIRVGWNLKLIDVATGQCIWAADESFDAADPLVEDAALRFQKQRTSSRTTIPGTSEPLLSRVINPGSKQADFHVILHSPSAFGRFSVRSVLDTLPTPAALKFSALKPM